MTKKEMKQHIGKRALIHAKSDLSCVVTGTATRFVEGKKERLYLVDLEEPVYTGRVTLMAIVVHPDNLYFIKE